jgi:uncharacterized membrane protein (TIGR01666 family)
MGLEILIVTFFFSMFNVYGSRAALVGNAAILVMILLMDKPISPAAAFTNSLFILAGGLWYMAISLLFYNIQPYRISQRALGECIREIATYLSIKASFYNTSTNLDEDYKKLVAQQIIVNDKQNALREILFKTRQIVRESTAVGRKLVLTFVDTVDLFEDITATYYDYDALRKRFGNTGVPDKIFHLVHDMAFELDRMGIAIQNNDPYKRKLDFEEKLRELNEQINELGKSGNESSLVLKKILVNLRALQRRINDVSDYFYNEARDREHRLDHSRFVSHQALDAKVFANNLTFHSSVFKHALRVMIACMAGYLVAQLLSYGHHSYWILMTIAFMLKPAFSLTKQRNIQRVAGTAIGGLIGVVILLFVPNKQVQFAFMVVFMLGTYSFQRTRYLAMVICTTPYILILFNFLGVAFMSLAEERLLDTLMGCTIAFISGYFLFPHWESHELEGYMQEMLCANKNYLRKILDSLQGKEINILEYKLARKDVYVRSANLTSAFQRMLSEPKSKQIESSKVHQFVVLNHILYSNIATLAITLLNRPRRVHARELIQLAKRSLQLLDRSIKKISNEAIAEEKEGDVDQVRSQAAMNADDQLLKEQLTFVQKISADIEKLVGHLTSETREAPTHILSAPGQ